MQNILALFEELGKIGHVFREVDLGGLGDCAVSHGCIEFIRRHGDAEIVGVLDVVKRVVKSDIEDFAELQRLGG